MEIRGQAPNRRAIASESCAAGKVIVEHRCDSWALLPSLWETHCQYCLCSGANAGKLYVCVRCRVAKYCGRHCQQPHWQVHKRECTAFAQLSKDDLADASLADALLLLRTPAEALINLNAEIRDRKPLEHCALLSQRLFGLEQSFDESLQRLAKFQQNNFVISDHLMQPVAYAVFPQGAMLNHSCCPNTSAMYFLGSGRVPRQCFVALENVESGEELTHSYVDEVMATEFRQRKLSEHYGFVCECARCKAPWPIDEEATRVTGRPEIFVKAVNMLHAIPRSYIDQPEKELKALLSLHDLVSQHVAPRHWIKRAVNAQIVQSALACGEWNAAKLAQRFLVDYDGKCYSAHHPALQFQCKLLQELEAQK